MTLGGLVFFKLYGQTLRGPVGRYDCAYVSKAFYVLFGKRKLDFLRWVSCCTRFLEHCSKHREWDELARNGPCCLRESPVAVMSCSPASEYVSVSVCRRLRTT